MTNFGNIFDSEPPHKPGKYKRTEKRVLIKSTGKPSSETLPGQVIAKIGKYFLVKHENQSGSEEIIECVAAGTIFSESSGSTIISVGDNIDFTYNPTKQTENIHLGNIVKVKQRKSFLSREAVGSPNEHVLASNIDYLVIMAAAADPFYNKRLIDRFLVASELGSLIPVICLNKIELMDKKILTEDFSYYDSLNIPVFMISCYHDSGIDKFFEFISNKSSVIAGQSGVGKSTLLNKMLGDEVQIINEISERTGKGQHTTTAVKMFSTKEHGQIIDTPGIREFGLWGIDKVDLSFYFHEFDPYFQDCKYKPCTHIHEPDCAVINALENGKIYSDRYESYLNIYNSLK